MAFSHETPSTDDRERREDVARRIVDGYRRVPQDESDGGWSDEQTAWMIAEEPW